MAKLRHVAIAVPDPQQSAAFYRDVFQMQIVGETSSPLAEGIYLSDGTICLALLKYKTDAAAGEERGKDYVGVHHIGFWCDDLNSQAEAIESSGGSFFMDLPVERESLHFESKYRDPNGVIFDISQNGWVGATK
jgi:catechol 2,3-dioxygenase-like lactoylglutathione lyase family enzyme